MTEHRDDSEMGRFERHGQRSYTARDAIGAVAVVALLLILFVGATVPSQGVPPFIYFQF